MRGEVRLTQMAGDGFEIVRGAFDRQIGSAIPFRVEGTDRQIQARLVDVQYEDGWVVGTFDFPPEANALLMRGLVT